MILTIIDPSLLQLVLRFELIFTAYLAFGSGNSFIMKKKKNRLERQIYWPLSISSSLVAAVLLCVLTGLSKDSIVCKFASYPFIRNSSSTSPKTTSPTDQQGQFYFPRLPTAIQPDLYCHNAVMHEVVEVFIRPPLFAPCIAYKMVGDGNRIGPFSPLLRCASLLETETQTQRQ